MEAEDIVPPDCGKERFSKRAFTLVEVCLPNELNKNFSCERNALSQFPDSSIVSANEMPVGLRPSSVSTRNIGKQNQRMRHDQMMFLFQQQFC